MTKRFLVTSLLLFGIACGAAFLVFRKGDEATVELTGVLQKVSTTPIPYIDLTIPYLQNRTYSSSLSELEKVGEVASYTSYLTSYTSDNLRVNGLLTIPKGEEPAEGWPAIVFVHGYIPPASYETQEKYEDYVASLARNGFVVFKIDLRGHDDSEGEATGSYYSSGYVIDTLNAVAALETADFVNGSKIGLWGHSMAGNIILRSFVAKRTLPAVVIWGGAGFTYADLQKYGLNDNSYQRPSPTSQVSSRRQQLFDTHGQFDISNFFWKQVAPTNYLDGVTGAIQLHHAVNDDVVNIGYSRELAGVLKEKGVEHEFFEYQSGGHNISGSAFTSAMNKTVEFFTEKLKEN